MATETVVEEELGARVRGLGAVHLAIEIIAVLITFRDLACVVVDFKQGLAITGQVVVIDHESRRIVSAREILHRLGNATADIVVQILGIGQSARSSIIILLQPVVGVVDIILLPARPFFLRQIAVAVIRVAGRCGTQCHFAPVPLAQNKYRCGRFRLRAACHQIVEKTAIFSTPQSHLFYRAFIALTVPSYSFHSFE